MHDLGRAELIGWKLIQFDFDLLDAIFFDFDGVLVDSVPLKTEAYQAIFAPFGSAAVDFIKQYHLKHGGIDRYTKIAKTLAYCGFEQENLTKTLAEQFAFLVKEQVISQPVISGMLELLQTLQERRKRAFIVSGTPEFELLEIVERKNLTQFFRSIRGSPDTKAQILRDLLQSEALSPERCVFIGDAVTDLEAALETGLWFVGFSTAG